MKIKNELQTDWIYTKMIMNILIKIKTYLNGVE